MPTELIIPVTKVLEIKEHPNAETLCIGTVLGYQVVMPLVEDVNGNIIKKFKKCGLEESDKRVPCAVEDEPFDIVKFKFPYEENQLVIYFPADTILPEKWIEYFHIKSFMRGKNKNRIGSIKLRGEPSFGFITNLPPDKETEWKEGTNVCDYYEAKKYYPPIKRIIDDTAAYDANIDSLFFPYSHIQNGRIYTNIFTEDEEVIATEKIHGTNVRLGFINGKRVAGSMKIRRKAPIKSDTVTDSEYNDILKSKIYWMPWSIVSVRNMLNSFKESNIILYGEVFGRGIQTLHYGKNNDLGFLAFDLAINGNYLDYVEFKKVCLNFGVQTVPELFRGKWSMETINKLTSGKTTLIENGHIREGIVVKPLKERTNPEIGRAILKYISNDYLLSKNKKAEIQEE